MAKLLGTVASFSNEKGFGFISHNHGPDVFVHYTAIQKTGYRHLHDGDEVEFEIVHGPKGPQADNVIVVAAKRSSRPVPDG